MERGLLGAVLFVIVIAGAAPMTAAGAPQSLPAGPETLAFHEFRERVKEYTKLQKAASHLRTTKRRKEIVDRRRALAEQIRETRASAKVGDIFTPEVSEEFRRVIRSTLEGSHSGNVRKTIRQGEPVAGWRLTVNGDYPEQLPLTTVPPTLLLRLPRLPAGVAYRIVGHDFVLQDTEARVVLDFIPGAIP